MLSNGGLTHVSEAKRAPVQLLESGPAAGALAGAWFGRNAGLDRVLAFDMGGTTAKLALVDEGEPLVAYGFEAAREKRFLRGSRPADPDRDRRTDRDRRRRRLDRAQVGASARSTSARKAAAPSRAPPATAAAAHNATVTDADLTLGYLNADFFLGGAMKIDRAATDKAFAALAVGPQGRTGPRGASACTTW